MNPKYSVDQTVYFLDDPEPGVVVHREHHGLYVYQVAFADMPDDWDGYWYPEGVLYEKPLASSYEDHPAETQSADSGVVTMSGHDQPN